MPTRNKKLQKMFDSVTNRIINEGKSSLLSPITGIRYEQPLKDEHPELDLALMHAQPGNIIAKAFAPSMAKGMVSAIASGDTESLLSSVIPGGTKVKNMAKVSKDAWNEMLAEEAIAEEGAAKRGILGERTVSQPISEAERLGIPKGMRSNPKALEDPYYWGYQQWNSRYNTAVNAGDLVEAQRLRDLHFKVKTPNNKLVGVNDYYHNTNDKSFYKIDLNKTGQNYKESKRFGRSAFFANAGYSDDYWGNSAIRLYVNGENPLFVGVGKQRFPSNKLIKDLNSYKYDVLAQSHNINGNDIISGIKETPFDEVVIFNPNHAKLGDAIIYDNHRQIIPIVKRDNFRNPDIRYNQGGKVNK